MNSKSVGELSEGMILARLLQLGRPVSLPFGNNQRYDMIIDSSMGLLRAQCKTGRLKSGCINFPTSSINGFTGKRHSYRGQVDVFLVYFPQNGNVYMVPVGKAGITECNLRLTPTRNNQRSGVRLAEDFKI